MALFVIWRDEVGARDASALQTLILEQAHIVAESTLSAVIASPAGRWNLVALSTRTHFHAARAQIWQGQDAGACVIHGLMWQMAAGEPRLLDAAAVASLLDRPGASLPDDVLGEYAVVRLYPDGSLAAFSDRQGLHQLFYAADGRAVLSNRASLVATVLDDRRPDPAGLIWLPAIGYRVGTATAYQAVTQLAQEHVLTVGADGLALATKHGAALFDFGGERGYRPALDALLDEGIAQAQAAIRLAIGDGLVDLPITGGKDSRVILALCLAAGLRDRLRLFTRGYDGHPDVVAGAGIAAALGLPHRREPPHGSDEPAHWTRERFFDKLRAQAWQSDGMVGGWDLILGERVATDTIISGHMGEVLKAYSKRPLPATPLDPLAMVRLQAPFDPMALLKPDAQEALRAQLAAQMAEARAAGALEADLPDLFYYRNRLPNWLGAIRGIKSFERQPVVPLGAPALLRLAFRLSPEERKIELLHFLIVQRCAHELLGLPFAHQRWDARLGESAPQVDPVLAAAGSPIFGNWQYSINHNAGIRAALAAEVEARGQLTLWRSIDRKALLDRLGDRRLDYSDGISMLGLVVAMFQEGGMVRPMKLGAKGVSHAVAAKPAPLLDQRAPRIEGCLDAVVETPEAITLNGWAHAPALPAAQVAIEALVGGASIGIAAADGNRPDLVAHGIGDGRHGFSLTIARDALAAAGASGATDILLQPFDGVQPLARATVDL